MKNKKQKFMRTGYRQYSKLGLRRKNKQKYRKSKGGENKIRLKKKGHLRNVSVGFRNAKKSRHLIRGLRKKMIGNIDDLKKLNKDEIGIVKKMGNKKKIELANYAMENNLRLFNLKSKEFLKKTEEILNERKKAREEKKKIKQKKAKEEVKKKSEKDKGLKQDEPKK